MLAAFPLVGSALMALWGLLWGLLVQCDESCSGEDWQHTADAPQWTLLAVLGVLVFAAGIATFVCVYRSRPWAALATLAAGALLLVLGLGFYGTNWGDEFHRHPLAIGAFMCVLLSGVLAAFLSAPDTS
jgi:predicted membrane channel-forming protein YqfA (hemolysin III family)